MLRGGACDSSFLLLLHLPPCFFGASLCNTVALITLWATWMRTGMERLQRYAWTCYGEFFVLGHHACLCRYHAFRCTRHGEAGHGEVLNADCPAQREGSLRESSELPHLRLLAHSRSILDPCVSRHLWRYSEDDNGIVGHHDTLSLLRSHGSPGGLLLQAHINSRIV